MPHFHIDYSPNLAERLDIQGLCACLHQAAVETKVFPLAGIRIRAMPCAHYIMGDGNPDHAFLDVSVRLREGRTFEVRKAATATIFAALEGYCADVMARSSLMVSLEMRNMDAELSPKAGSIRDYMSEDGS